jgi:hypothetical protein
VIRSIAVIVRALELASPGWSEQLPPREEVAAHVRELARAGSFDPFTLIAVVENESRWRPTVIGGLGEVGLGQIRPENFPECRGAGAGSEACDGVRQALLGWRYNLQVAARLLTTWREYCRRRVGSALAVYWLQGYQGFDASRSASCGHVRERARWRALPIPALTRRILARRAELAERTE